MQLFADKQAANSEFLPPEQAFQLDFVFVPSTQKVHLYWKLAPGYYLYRHKIQLTQTPDTEFELAIASLPEGQYKKDEFLGEVYVFYDELSVPVQPIEPQPRLTQAPLTLTAKVTYQGCADAGLCYPPQHQQVSLTLDHTQVQAWLTGAHQPKLVTVSAAEAQKNIADAQAPLASTSAQDVPQNSDPTTLLGPQSQAQVPTPPASEQQTFSQHLAQASLGSVLILFALAGLGLTFTPCVLPMLPIMSTLILGAQDKSTSLTRARAFSLALAYVLAMAFTYALLGSIMGIFGASLNLQAHLQSPGVLSAAALLFVIFAGAMFGYYDLSLPRYLQDKFSAWSQKTQGGSLSGAAVMGTLSTLVVSPCLSAPLAGALVYISSTQDALLGGLALFSLGLGMGIPLILVAVFGQHFLPKAGAWMQDIKYVFAWLLLAMAVWLVTRWLAPQWHLWLWGSLALAGALAIGLSSRALIRRILGVWLFLYACALLIGAWAGHTQVTRPLGFLTSQTGPSIQQSKEIDLIPAYTSAQVQAALAQAPANTWVLVDLYADWCVSCKIIEDQVFPDPRVQAHLQQMQLIRWDVTDNTPDQQALMDQWGLFGPPSLLFFYNQKEASAWRLQGEFDAASLSQHLQRLSTP
ncbi:thiol:disulfide interchange protein DsbD [Allopseudospirillum japonicum]|uniref:Thiol:disulfide interchange protein DsbD n=1 Tax=Allopseudospirillum japonicum TaxID=64971 RepID=A0A1H6T9C4_9GAMM|nr:protein-disulfide reductase DsbD [Allopseudospirillum japonicum]SEI72432.1 thiol:disulfide interchange protein DsbD [Allopseudospirillum japonicum]